MRWLRLARILWISLRFGLDELILDHARLHRTQTLLRGLLCWRPLSEPRAVRLRRALESLGPVFVKFGQMLSTRRDLLPQDIADELAKLQDQVPPCPAEQIAAVLQQAYGAPAERTFAHFDPIPIASASVAQVHCATLHDGTPVAVKVLRPNIAGTIAQDLALMDSAAWLLEKLWVDGKRLKPRAVVGEFAHHIHQELDLLLEAAHCSQLRRNFADERLLRVPEVYWDGCREQVMVMQRMEGTPISQVARLGTLGVDIKQLARDGVEIFFTQVFRDGFFHADMHPGNILVASDGRYIALDFGIMGTLEETDKNYLARNFLAFFRRDYSGVVRAHIESGWVPAATRPGEFEAAIRAACEPIFDKPLGEISFGRLLVRLFQTSRRFGVEIQPQLIMLQKTLLNIEGLGRDLDPELDLWVTAKPFLERWMSEQLGWRGALKTLRTEAPYWAQTLPQLPRLIHQKLAPGTPEGEHLMAQLARQLHLQNRLLLGIAALLAALLWTTLT